MATGGNPHRILIGTSGWVYSSWHGPFYPRDLRRGGELEHLSRRLGSAEINASFYSLQRPEHYRRWVEQTPDDFVFAVKGSRFITHMKKLRDAETALANFFASGVLALGRKMGPLLWQLPPSLPFDADRLEAFFRLLPRSTAEAAELAARHDARLAGRALTETDADRPVRHALEVRHPSFAAREPVELLRAHDIALVVADAAGDWPRLEDVTSDFVSSASTVRRSSTRAATPRRTWTAGRSWSAPGTPGGLPRPSTRSRRRPRRRRAATSTPTSTTTSRPTLRRTP